MYPATGKTVHNTGNTVKKVIGGVVMVMVCVTVGAAVIYAIKKIAESDAPPTEQPLSMRIFTNNRAIGRQGSSKLHYKDPRLVAEVTVKKGIQHWTVPQTGIWILEARGAAGADGLLKGGTRLDGGWGAQVRGKFILKKGEVLKILIGQEGTRDFVDPRRAGGGGGGTFVVRSNGKPLLIAGGGGGGGIPPPAAFQTKGEGGRTKDIRSKTDTSSGVQGRGGKLFDTDTSKLINVATGNHKVIAGAGGGFNSDGVGFYKNWGGKSFVHGGVGGEATPKYTKFDHGTRGEGGFGGGGAAGLLPGAGGGYSGGGVSGCWLVCGKGKEAGTAAGGSSFNKGAAPHHKADTNEGNGRVYATFVTGDPAILSMINARK
ncbi:hypothetical protein QZH41_008506 [Actinostola sp. cb2023]|nr:hypothetical protein QZH41_008506 [Actinostola sp. cb2023]